MSISPTLNTTGAPSTQSKRIPALTRVLVTLVVLALAGVVVGVFLVGPRLCGLTEPERHGLACDIPLPANAKFAEQPDPGSGPVGGSIEAWAYTVPAADAGNIADLYARRLPEEGWTCLQTNKVDLLGSAEATVVALNGNQAISVALNPTSTPGIAQLLIVVTTFPRAPSGTC